MKIYVIKIKNIAKNEFDKIIEVLPEERKNKINKYFRQQDKVRSLVSSILIRNIIKKKSIYQ